MRLARPPGRSLLRLLRRVALALALAAVAVWVLSRTLTYLRVHDQGIHRAAAGLEARTQDRDRPHHLPFQRLSDELLWENIPGYVVQGTDPPELLTNSLGCQGPEPELGARRPRILTLGDSSTFGLGVAPAETYSARLRELLGPDADVQNGGVVGYTALQGLAQLRRLGPLLRPAVVVAAFGYNERWLHRTGDAAALAARRRAARYELLFRSEAFLLLRYLLLDVRPTREAAAEGEWRPRLHAPEYEAALDELCALAGELGARPVLLTLAENPGITGPILAAQAALEAGDAQAAADALLQVVGTRWHRYPLIDELCARVLETLGRERTPTALARRAALSERRNWGRVFGEQPYLDAAGRVAARRGAALVRFPPRPDGALYADDIHPSAEGHRWIAEQIALELDRRGWLVAVASGR